MNDVIDSTDRQPKQQGLYLVSTPIGNLRDMTLRALDVLADADAVLCEDSRVTGKLMQAFNLKKKLIVYNDHSDDTDRARIIERLEAGAMLALVSDAGTPLLSDPGFKLVRAAMGRGIRIVPVPGASALLPALQLGALAGDRFLFAGFPPHKTTARRAFYESLKTVPAMLVFYESPNRIADSVADAYAVLGDRPAALARELTKMFEEVRHGTLAAWAADPGLLGTLKGEMVLMIGPPPAPEKPSADDLRARLVRALETMSVKDAAAHIASETGVAKKIVYDLAVALRNEEV